MKPTVSEWAVSIGLPKPGRGRPSAEFVAKRQAAYDNGQRFSDWPRVEQVVKTRRGKEKTILVKPEGEIAETPPPVVPPTTKIKLKSTNRVIKGVSLNDVCRNTGYSLSYCGCYWTGKTHSVIIGSSGFAEVVLDVPDEGN